MTARIGQRNSMRIVLTSAVIAAGCLCGSAEAEVRFVRKDAPPGGDGLSWATAWNDLGPGLASVFGNFAVTEIWVASGTYYPTQTFDFGVRDKSFMLRKDLAVLGGFDGTETLAAERDPAVNLTILSGDLGTPGVATDNALHVVRTDFSTAFSGLTAVLDGFTVEGGYANVNFSNVGGGILADGSATIRRCIIQGNFASVSGGGVWAQRATVFESCSFVANTNGGSGGAAVMFEGNGAPLTFNACEFISNSGNAGAVRCQQATFSDCLFEANSGSGSGAITWYGNNAQSLTIRNSVFRDNTSTASAGAILGISSGELSIVGSAFVGNAATADGAGAINRTMSNLADRIQLTRFLGNSGGGGNGGGAIRGGAIEFVGCEFSGNTAIAGGAIAAQSTRPIVNCTFSQNVATSGAGAIHAVGTNVQLSNCILWGNAGAGGATQVSQLVCGAAPTIRQSIIQYWNGSFGGPGNSGADPLFVDPIGADLLSGTDDDDLRLTAPSPAIDSADATWLPADALDVDTDGNLVELLPLDVDGSARLFDDPAVVDSGAGNPAYLDRGAHEFDPGEFSPAVSYIGPPGGSWFEPTHWSNGAIPGPRAEVVIGSSVLLTGGVAAIASLDIGSGGSLQITKGELSVDSISLGGSAVLTLGRGGVLDLTDGSIGGSSSFVWQGGELRVRGSLESSAALTINSGTLLLVDADIVAPLISLLEQGTLRGVGTLSGGVLNGGTVEVGGVEAIGSSISIGEVFTQTTAGSLRLPLIGFGAAASPARLVASQATLDGGIATTNERGLFADVHADHVVIEAGSISGSFSTIELPIPPTGFAYEVVYGADEVRLRSRLAESGPRLYVRIDAAPGGDGQSWATATASLLGAMKAAAVLDGSASDIEEIWVAAGTHRPIDDALDASDGYPVPPGVAIFGGFAGDETSVEERDPVAHPTVLSGDMLLNDVEFPRNPTLEPSRVDNAGPLLFAHALGTPSSLDGLIVTDGYQGPTCGAFDIVDSTVTIVDCTFLDNAATNAGAIAARGASSLEVHNSRFVANWGSSADLRLLNSSVAVITDSQFDGSADPLGFGPVVQLSAFTGSAVIERCSFLGSTRAGGITASCPLVLRDSEISGYPATALSCSSEVRVERSRIAGPGPGGIFVEQNASLEIVQSILEGFSGNLGYSIYAVESSEVHAVNCIVRGNSDASGAAIRLLGAEAIFEGCLIYGNASPSIGGAILSDDSDLTLRYCTVFANRAEQGGGILCSGKPLSGSLTVDRCILWRNLNGEEASFESQIDFGPLEPKFIAVNGSIVQFVPAHLGLGNLDLDPQFVDPLGPDLVEGTGDENCDLKPISPAVNLAPGSTLPADTLDADNDGDTVEALPIDVLGQVRLRGGAVDLGAIERFEPADLDDNRTVSGSDLAILLGAWQTPGADLNGDGTTNGADLAILLGAWNG